MVLTTDPRFRIEQRILTLKLPLKEVWEAYTLPKVTFMGAVIDIESDEQPFMDSFRGAHRYRNFNAVCCGFLDSNLMEIIGRTDTKSDKFFKEAVASRLDGTIEPYYAFNAGFDMAVLSRLLGRNVNFHGELRPVLKWKKEYYRRDLVIPSFDDPFGGEGKLASAEWTSYLKTGNIDSIKKIMAHNAACVCTEYSMLTRKGYKAIQQLSCQEFYDGKSELACDDCITSCK
jgi:hypothetical protein